MCISVMSAAKRMCEQSNWTLSNLKIQKILYIAHMFHLGREDAPLVPGHFEAWAYGPVHPDLYHALKMFGSSPVENIFRRTENSPEGSERRLLDEAVQVLADAEPGKLVRLTHYKNGAWARHYRPRVRGIPIPNESILAEYREWRNSSGST